MSIFENKFVKYLVILLLVLLNLVLLSKFDFLFSMISKILSQLFIPVLVSTVLFFILKPLARWFEGKKVPRTLSVILSIVIALIVIAALVFYGGNFFVAQITEFVKALPEYSQVWTEKITELLENEFIAEHVSIASIKQRLSENIGTLVNSVSSGVFTLISSTVDIGTKIVIIPFILFYMLKDSNKLVGGIIKMVPQKKEQDVRKMLRDLNNVMSAYIVGQCIVALCIGILMTIGYLIIGMPNALVLGMFAMITTIIPFIGPFLGIVPALFIGFGISWFMILKILIVFVVAQQLEGNFISPVVMGNKLSIHPLMIILLVILAVRLYGVLGAFIVVPAYAMIKVIFGYALSWTKEAKAAG